MNKRLIKRSATVPAAVDDDDNEDADNNDVEDDNVQQAFDEDMVTVIHNS